MEPVTWTFDCSGTGPDTSSGEILKWYAEELEQRTNGLIKVKHIWSFGMSRPSEELPNNQAGLSQLVKLVQGFYPSELRLNSFSQAVPFTLTDPVAAGKVHDVIYYDERLVDPEFESLDLKFLFGLTGESYTLFSTRPVTKLADLEAMKMALTPEPYFNWLEAVKAVPLGITLADRVPGLETGMIEGSLLTLDLQTAFGEDEVCPYLMSLDFGAIVYELYAMNLGVWNDLPKNMQDIIDELNREASERAVATDIRWKAKIREELKTAGTEMNPPLSFEEKTEWSNMLSEFVLQWTDETEQMGKPAKAVMKRYMELVNETGYKFPREWKVE
ncbi:TRAP transporter substrate-binding protein DctP [Chloroflexota bacterium]